MLIPDAPALGILFDINLLNATLYGEAAWRIFLDVVDVRKIAPISILYSGDTAASLSGEEYYYCIAVQNESPVILTQIQDLLRKASSFRRVNPTCRFINDESIQWEPLCEVGFVTEKGRLIGFPGSFESHYFIRCDNYMHDAEDE
jgi:hypothetical protein